LILVN
jgi:hypothetical protein